VLRRACVLGTFLVVLVTGPCWAQSVGGNEQVRQPADGAAAEPGSAADEAARTLARHGRPLDTMAAEASASYRPGPVFSRGPSDPTIFRGPFVLRRTPVIAEHKHPWQYGVSIRVVRHLRYYPFLGFEVYADYGDKLRLIATNLIYNSIEVPRGTDFLEVPQLSGLGYVEVPHEDGTTEKFVILRLRDNTLKVTRLDESGRGVFAAYTISGRVWAKYAQRFVDTDEPVELTIYPREWADPRQGPVLKRLLAGHEPTDFRGYWTLPERDHLRGGDWGGISMPRESRAADTAGEGEERVLPIDIGAFDVIFEQALPYTGSGYRTLPKYTMALFFPTEPGDLDAPSEQDPRTPPREAGPEQTAAP